MFAIVDAQKRSNRLGLGPKVSLLEDPEIVTYHSLRRGSDDRIDMISRSRSSSTPA